MPRGRRGTTLAELERQLAELNATRQKVLAAIRSTVEELMAQSSAGAVGLRKTVVRRAKAIRPRRRLSVAGRRRLSQLAKERWAKARKAGLKRLG